MTDILTLTIDALTQARQQLLDLGAPDEAIHYLLPNSQRIRFYESGTLLAVVVGVAALALRPLLPGG